MEKVIIKAIFLISIFTSFATIGFGQDNLKNQKDSSTVFHEKGMYYLKVSKIDSAAIMFQKSIDIGTKNALNKPKDSYFQLALLKIKKQDTCAACKNLEEAFINGEDRALTLYIKNCTRVEKVKNNMGISDTNFSIVLTKKCCIDNEKDIFNFAEERPMFKDKDEDRLIFLAENIHYPQMARESGIQGTVYVSFVVELDGGVSNIKILRGIGGGCDEETFRVVSLMKSWTPGKINNISVRTKMIMPVKFMLMNDTD